MSTKRKSSNGFFQFCRQKQKENPSWAAMTPPELVEVCSPLWTSLSVEGRSRYMRECKKAMGGGVVKGGYWYDSYRRPLDLLVNRTRQSRIEQENMKTNIKTNVDNALMDQKMEMKVSICSTQTYFASRLKAEWSLLR